MLCILFAAPTDMVASLVAREDNPQRPPVKQSAPRLSATQEAVEAVEGGWRIPENSEVRDQKSECRMTDAGLGAM